MAKSADTPSYEQKKLIDLNDNYTFNSSAPGDSTIADIARGPRPKSGDASGNYDLARHLYDIGLGNYTVSNYNENARHDVDFVEKYNLGKTYSYQDLALEALQGDPNFDPADTTMLSSFAQDLEKRGFKLKDREKIQTLATTQGVQGQIDRAVNPGKYLTADQTAANRATATQLAQQYGQEDPHLIDFLTEQIANGDSPFELSQFLQTTPQYLEKKSAQDREAINQELLASENEVFKRAIPQIVGGFQKAGRLGSSGVESALANARAELARERQSMLTGFAREDVVGARNAAFQNYLRSSEPGYQQRFNVQNAQNYNAFQMPYQTLNRQYSLNDQARARQYELEDYARQQSDFNRYLADARSQSRGSAIYGLLGSGISGLLQGYATGGRRDRRSPYDSGPTYSS